MTSWPPLAKHTRTPCLPFLFLQSSLCFPSSLSPLRVVTHVEGQAVGLVCHGEASQLSQSDLVGDGLVHSAKDEGLSRGGQEGHDLWGDEAEQPKVTGLGSGVWGLIEMQLTVLWTPQLGLAESGQGWAWQGWSHGRLEGREVLGLPQVGQHVLELGAVWPCSG